MTICSGQIGKFQIKTALLIITLEVLTVINRSRTNNKLGLSNKKPHLILQKQRSLVTIVIEVIYR